MREDAEATFVAGFNLAVIRCKQALGATHLFERQS